VVAVALVDWLSQSAEVSRQVNWLYFFIVLMITMSVLAIAVYTKNRRAVLLFAFSIVIWSAIEALGLVVGFREYQPHEDRLVIFIFVAWVEDPGWVCLSYMIAEWLIKGMWKPLLRKAGIVNVK
jgi:predicted neutral ceramidase superfamily lipid hydrolase